LFLKEVGSLLIQDILEVLKARILHTRHPVRRCLDLKIAVLGGGNGAHVMAADLSMAGHEVRWFELPRFAANIKAAMDKGGVELDARDFLGEELVSSAGGESGFARISKITTDIKEAVKGAQVIHINVPSFGQMTFVEEMSPYLEHAQVIVFHPDNFATLECAKFLKGRGIERNVVLAGTECMIYACRISGPGKVRLFSTKDKVGFAALPATKTMDALRLVNESYPQYFASKNVLEESIHNVNFVAHPSSMILNVVNIEKFGSYEYRAYDTTPGVANVMEALDREKCALAKSYGLTPTPYKDILRRYYGAKGKDIYEAIRNCKAYVVGASPDSMKFRYVTEDIPYGHVPVTLLAKIANVPTPTFDAMISLAEAINQENYRTEGRTLQKLGLDGMDARQVTRYVNEGL